MKRFLKSILLFCFIAIAVIATIEIGLRFIPNAYKYKHNWMDKNANRVEVLILGSSHTFYGVRPEFFDGVAFNLALPTQRMTEDLQLLKKWENKYKHLKTVICPVSYMTFFNDEIENTNEWFRCRYYKLYMDCDIHNVSFCESFEVSHIPSAKEKLIQFVISGQDCGFDALGWGTKDKLSEKKSTWDEPDATAAIKRHTAEDWTQVELRINQLKEIAQFCMRNNIQLVLITTPCWKSYTEKINKKQYMKMGEAITLIQNEYNVKYLNYLNDIRFEADDFYDSNHLSDVGAAKFSKILNKDIHEQ